jgi:hypothetical protein
MTAKKDWGPIQKLAAESAAALGHTLGDFDHRPRFQSTRMASCETCFGCCWASYKNSGFTAGGRILKYKCGTKEAMGLK